MCRINNLIFFKVIFFCYVTILPLLLSLTVFGQTDTDLPQNWYCDERLNLNLKAGTVTEIIPYKKGAKSIPKQFTQDGLKYEVTGLIKFKVVDLFVGSETGEVAQYFNVKSQNLPAVKFEIGEKYLFEANTFQSQLTGKDEIIRPNNFLKLYQNATTDIEFLQRVKDQNVNQAILNADFLDVVPAKSADIKTVLLVKPFRLKSSQEFKINNTVYVLTVIDETGRVVKAKAFCAKNTVVAEASEQAAMLSRFAPILKDGSPTKVKGIIVYKFEEKTP